MLLQRCRVSLAWLVRLQTSCGCRRSLAAIHVQAAWKGYVTRLWHAKLCVLVGVIVIQRCFRHFLLRRRLVSIVRLHIAVRRIQSCWRMHVVYRKYRYVRQ